MTVVVQSSDAALSDLVAVTRPAIEGWATAVGCGYAFVCPPKAHPYAYKFFAVSRLLGDGADAVIWVDADVVPIKMGPIGPFDRELAVSQDYHGHCLGVFLVRNTPWVRSWCSFMAQTIPLEPVYRTEDQGLFKALAAIRSVNEKVSLIPEWVVGNPATPMSLGDPVLYHFWANSESDAARTAKLLLAPD